MHLDIQQFVSNNVVCDIVSDAQNQWGTANIMFPSSLMVNLMDVAKGLQARKIDRIDACMSVLSLAKDADRLDKKIILLIHHMQTVILILLYRLLMLPFEAVMHPINESEYCTRYLLPTFQCLFDDDQRSVKLRWTSTEAVDDESKPDCLISIMTANYVACNIGFGEVKSESESKDHRKANFDLVRLGIFAKNAIDNDSLTGTVAIHAVGTHACFYLVQLKADGLYTMIELGNMNVPLSICELHGYLAYLSDLKVILKVFEDQCLPITTTSFPNRKRKSYSLEKIDPILTKTRDRKRKNIVSHQK
ncbi:hypothetical protein BCV72DRAFT_280627 [Rhizopus microsporus var. microsporus]|uniref:Uncharacterized protein n=2 Tax=Rhizopus microsporus TaxID=58291 RepID=A0A2G4SL16_RHIZD|nr:uncharacterized protein RHIMIDRAFT_315646 [Rhizopus microsporus ATCC 52813]ORE02554.1 hypothetical protein BCV72DRAFT_280627 [Rhizopus microsporus var. microsporus]PHZ09076.1 hypothetical protein RHIMIDRAFT_315646 [Rhizopus microsporus ATCC 52813]